jgi:hypothetical protein
MAPTRIVYVDLSFLTSLGLDDDARFDGPASAKLLHVAHHAAVAASEPMIGNEVLVDPHRIATPRQRFHDHVVERHACARSAWARTSRNPEVGDRFVGRFCSPPFARRSDRDAGALQVRAGGLASNARRLLDAPQTPAEPAQCFDLLLLLFAQDVGHPEGSADQIRNSSSTSRPPHRWPVLIRSPMAGFHRSSRARLAANGRETPRCKAAGTSTRSARRITLHQGNGGRL